MTDKDKLLRNLAKRYNVSMQQARDIEDSLSFVAHIMKEKSDRDKAYFPSVRIPSLGIFYCPEKFKNKLKEINQRDETNTV